LNCSETGVFVINSYIDSCSENTCIGAHDTNLKM
jgi:hypothetical protein